MHTRCNHCQNILTVTAAQLALTQGVMRCSQCGQQFDPWANLQRETPSDGSHAPTPAWPDHRYQQAALDLSFSASTANAPEPSVPGANEVEPAPDSVAGPSDSASDAAGAEATELAGQPADSPTTTPDGITPVPDSDVPSVELDVATPTSDTRGTPEENRQHVTHARPGMVEQAAAGISAIPSFARAPAGAAAQAPVETVATPRFFPSPVAMHDEAPPRDRSWPRWLAVAALAVLLLAQSLYAERDSLAASRQWRPWLATLCAGLGCSLPAWHEPSALHVLSRDVRPHPSVEGALLISASFRNDALWSQAWPALQLTLSNLDGQTIAKRRFAPSEYLGLSLPGGAIEPGQTASISLEVRDPGKQAVAFEFEFL
jgi:predicted Zn finger-like uncharacterized protein